MFLTHQVVSFLFAREVCPTSGSLERCPGPVSQIGSKTRERRDLGQEVEDVGGVERWYR